MRDRRLLAALLIVVAPSVGRAQGEPSLAGLVQNAATRRPLIGAIVTLGEPGNRTTRTDESGGFIFTKLRAGEYTVQVRHLGFEPVSQRAVVTQATRITVALTRLAALDTVRVRAARQAIYGVVARASDLKPLGGATVQVFGASVGHATTDSTGHFFYAIQTPGAYLVRSKVRSYGSQTVSVTVQPREGVEVALLLDSAEAPGANMLEQAFFDFQQRLLRRGLSSVMVPRTELLARGNGGVVSNLLLAKSFGAKALHFSDTACLFIDGQPKPGMSAQIVDAADVEAVEVYTSSADRPQTLMRRWPAGAPCGDTGQPRSGPGRVMLAPGQRAPQSDVVYWVVIWLKH